MNFPDGHPTLTGVGLRVCAYIYITIMWLGDSIRSSNWFPVVQKLGMWITIVSLPPFTTRSFKR